MNRFELNSLLKDFLKFQEESKNSGETLPNEELIEKFLQNLKTEPAGDNKLQMFRDIQEECRNLYIKKQNDYGDSFGQTFNSIGIASSVTRIFDKVNRLVSLIKVGKQRMVEDEKIEDTLKDLANYSTMTVIELRLKGKDGENS